MTMGAASWAGFAPRALGLMEELILKPIRQFDDLLGARRPRTRRERAEPSAAGLSLLGKPHDPTGDVVANEQVNRGWLLEVGKHPCETRVEPDRNPAEALIGSP